MQDHRDNNYSTGLAEQQGGDEDSGASTPLVLSGLRKKTFKKQNFNTKLSTTPAPSNSNAHPAASGNVPAPSGGAAPAPAPAGATATGAVNESAALQAQVLALQQQLEKQQSLLENMVKLTLAGNGNGNGAQGAAPVNAGQPQQTVTPSTYAQQQQQQGADTVWGRGKAWAPKPVAEAAPRSSGISSSTTNAGEDKSADFLTKSEKQGKMRQASKTEAGKKKVEEQLFGADHVTQGIDFDKYDNIPVETSGRNIPEPLENGFENVALSENLLMNINRARYLHPTPIQRHAIPMILASRDVMACAQTGSGKTAAFLFPIITRLEQGKRIPNSLPQTAIRRGAKPRGLILAPTRELSSQIHDEAMRFTYQSTLRTVVVYGGAEVRSQTSELYGGVDIVVATPGRLVDLIQRSRISLSAICFLVLDEADRMLDMGFEPQVREIVSGFDMPSLEDGRQTSMFSATFPKEIQKLAQDFLGDYLFVTVGRVGSTTTTVEQRLVWCDYRQKTELLVQQLRQIDGLTLVFVSTKRDCDIVEETLNSIGIPTASIHGDKMQREREMSLWEFTTGKVRVLVATDVAARGLDINNVAHVINYDTPNEIDSYVHRVGRTGRAGNKGIATTFFTESDAKMAPLILDLLEEAAQEVPSWLRSVADQVKSGGFVSRGPRRGGGGRGGHGERERFGARDVRDLGSGSAQHGGGGGGGGRSGGSRGNAPQGGNRGKKSVEDAW